MKLLRLTLCFFPMLAACGGGSDSGAPGQSGVSGSKSIAELTDPEASQLCEWSLKTEGGAGSVTKCADGSERQTHSKEECMENLHTLRTITLPCTITVNDAEACSLETQKDACGKPKPSCDRINACVDKAAKK